MKPRSSFRQSNTVMRGLASKYSRKAMKHHLPVFKRLIRLQQVPWKTDTLSNDNSETQQELHHTEQDCSFLSPSSVYSSVCYYLLHKYICRLYQPLSRILTLVKGGPCHGTKVSAFVICNCAECSW